MKTDKEIDLEDGATDCENCKQATRQQTAKEIDSELTRLDIVNELNASQTLIDLGKFIKKKYLSEVQK
jgi:hypothetical protein